MGNVKNIKENAVKVNTSTMTLGVLERILLLNLLPRESDVTTIRIIRDIRKELGFTEEEHKILNFKLEGNKTVWDEKVGSTLDKDFTFGEKIFSIIVEELVKLNHAKKLTEHHLTLWDKFILSSSSGGS